MSQSTEINQSFKKSYEETHIEWEITVFFSVKYKIVFYQSPTFSFADDSWYMRLYLKSIASLGFVALYLYNSNQREYSVEYNFGLKKLDGSSEQLLTGILHGHEEVNERGPFIKLSEAVERKCELTRSDALTITGTLKRGTILSVQPSVLDKPKLMKLISLDTLSEDFRNLFGNKDSCDTTLCVKDKEYKVHRAVLIARSDVFAAMFQHDTSEKQTGIIAIPDCEPESFQQFLEYLYCGKLEEISFHTAFHLYSTSDKYNVEKLKTFCVDYLMQCITAENFCSIIILADKFDETELFAAAQDFFNKNLNQILETSEWDCLWKGNYRLAKKLLKEMSLKIKVVG